MSVVSDGAFALTDQFGRPIQDELPDADMGVGGYGEALLAYLPSGRVWPREPDSTLVRVMTALALTFARLDGRARYLLRESPSADSLLELLPEWERTLGLPDPCSGAAPTVLLRQQAVRGKLAARGGQSVPYFVAVAAALGYAITITEFAPARADVLCADQPVYDPAWAYAWQVNAPQVTVNYFRADENFADEPLASFGNEALICTLTRIKPAHTVLSFSFS